MINTLPDWIKNTPYGDGSGHVGKYDTLWVWQREDGMRWCVHLNKWSADENEGTSFLEALVTNPNNHLEGIDIDEYSDYVVANGPLPEGGELVNINEP